jgi:hypothetical protein
VGIQTCLYENREPEKYETGFLFSQETLDSCFPAYLMQESRNDNIEIGFEF